MGVQTFSEAADYGKMGRMPTGRVKWYDRKRRFGFIQLDDGGPDAFVHQPGISPEHPEPLIEGEPVQFEIRTSVKGPIAVNVRSKPG